jgi:hypothetical protein
MAAQNEPLPHWTWEDLEAVLDGFSPSGPGNPLRDYLIRGLAEDAKRASSRELLKQVLSAGWVMAQLGTRGDDSATAHRPETEARAF